MQTIGMKVINGKQLARMERLWPLYRLGRIALTGVTSAAALLLVDDLLSARPQSLAAYGERLTNATYVQALCESAPLRFRRMATQASEWCEKQMRRLR